MKIPGQPNAAVTVLSLLGLVAAFQLFFRYEYIHTYGPLVTRIDRLTGASCILPCTPAVTPTPAPTPPEAVFVPDPQPRVILRSDPTLLHVLKDEGAFDSIAGIVQQPQNGDEGSGGGLFRVKLDNGSVVKCFHNDSDFVVVEMTHDGKFHTGGITSYVDHLYGKAAILTYRGSLQEASADCTFIDALVIDQVTKANPRR